MKQLREEDILQVMELMKQAKPKMTDKKQLDELIAQEEQIKKELETFRKLERAERMAKKWLTN